MDGALDARVARADGASFVLFYTGEQRGSLDPCGCPDRPRGGIPRTHGYRDAAVRAAPEIPTLLVAGGHFLEDAMGLDGEPRAEVPTMNRYMVEGLTRVGFQALNVGYADLAGLRSLPEGTDTSGLALVSANVRGPGIEPYRVIEAGGSRVGITGLTARGVTFLATPGFALEDPTTAGRAVLRELREESDVVVLLSYQASDAARALALEGLVDVVIDTNLHTTFDEPFRVGSAIWLRSHLETMRLGELRLWVEDGAIVQALDRKIDLDDRVTGDPADETLAEEARRALAPLVGRVE